MALAAALPDLEIVFGDTEEPCQGHRGLFETSHTPWRISICAELDFDENFADSGQVTAERGEVEALSGQLSETLQDIEDALAKFDAGTYGECESCGQPIPEARLEAMPAARLCISCASQRR